MQNNFNKLPAKERISVFKSLPANKQSSTILRMSKYLQKRILRGLSDDEISQIVDYLDPDKAADVLQNMGSSRRARIVKGLGEAIRKKVDFLLKFDPRTAAGIMSLDYIEIPSTATFEYVSKIIRKHEKRTGKFPTILIVEDGFLVGEIPAHALALAGKEEKIAKYVRKVPSIQYTKGNKDVISVFRKNPHNKIVVLDDDKSIMGIIYSDDVLKIVEEQSARTLQDFAGVSREENVFDSAFSKVKHRYKWLLVNLATAFLAASVVSLFQDTISAFVALAVYMPIVAGMGGNAGTQTMAVLVRGLALGEISLETGKRALINEALAGGMNGVITGVIAAFVAVLWNKTPMLGLIVGLAMVINLVIAGFFGALVPLVMSSLGKDPASSATVFITTATDVFGFLSFLGLASLVL